MLGVEPERFVEERNRVGMRDRRVRARDERRDAGAQLADSALRLFEAGAFLDGLLEPIAKPPAAPSCGSSFSARAEHLADLVQGSALERRFAGRHIRVRPGTRWSSVR